MAQLQFDARQVQPDTVYELLPAGWYKVMVTESEVKPTKDGSGMYLATTYTIIDGQYKGRKLFGRFNLKNKNEQAQEIGYKQLSALAHAVGHLVVGDSSELHNKPLQIRIKIREAQGNYDQANDVIGWKNISEQVGAAPAAQAPAFNPANIPPAAAPQAYAPVQQQAQASIPPVGWQQAQAAQPAPVQQAPVQQVAWAPPAGQQPWQAPQQAAAPAATAPVQSAPPPWQQPRS